MAERKLGIKGDLRKNVQRYVEILRPFNKLSSQEGKLIAEIVLEYMSMREKVKDEDLLWKLVLEDNGSRAKIAENVGIERYMMNTILWRLRKKGVIKDNRVHSVYIPVVEKGGFVLSFVFKVEP